MRPARRRSISDPPSVDCHTTCPPSCTLAAARVAALVNKYQPACARAEPTRSRSWPWGEPLPSPACPHRGPNWAGCAIDVRGLRSNGLRVLTTGDQLRAYVQRSRTEFNVGCRGQLGCAGRGVSIRSRELRLGDCASDRYALVGPGVHVDAGHPGCHRRRNGQCQQHRWHSTLTHSVLDQHDTVSAQM